MRPMEVDPNSSYLKMFHAMRDANLATARRLAKAMQQLIDHGMYPTFYSRAEVIAYVASVLRRTAGCEEDQED